MYNMGFCISRSRMTLHVWRNENDIEGMKRTRKEQSIWYLLVLEHPLFDTLFDNSNLHFKFGPLKSTIACKIYLLNKLLIIHPYPHKNAFCRRTLNHACQNGSMTNVRGPSKFIDCGYYIISSHVIQVAYCSILDREGS